jgi:GDP-mannose 6-dehydrogenase
MKITIFGLGYVGATSAACFSKLGNIVYGIDIIKERVDGMNKGQMPFYINGLDNLMQEQVKKKRLKATMDYKDILRYSDISFICVQTPCRKNGDIDLSAVERVCDQIKEYSKKDHLAVIRSTVFPNQLSKLENILKRDYAVNPEFLREATAIEDFFDPPFIVVGARNKYTFEKVMSCYGSIPSNIKRLNTLPEIAQMLKYASNSWHACKIAFTNEIGEICKDLKIDGDKVMELFCEDKKLNISNKYHKIGSAYGGHCLPKDLSVLQYQSKKLNLPLIKAISKSNNKIGGQSK